MRVTSRSASEHPRSIQARLQRGHVALPEPRPYDVLVDAHIADAQGRSRFHKAGDVIMMSPLDAKYLRHVVRLVDA